MINSLPEDKRKNLAKFVYRASVGSISTKTL